MKWQLLSFSLFKFENSFSSSQFCLCLSYITQTGLCFFFAFNSSFFACLHVQIMKTDKKWHNATTTSVDVRKLNDQNNKLNHFFKKNYLNFILGQSVQLALIFVASLWGKFTKYEDNFCFIKKKEVLNFMFASCRSSIGKSIVWDMIPCN